MIKREAQFTTKFKKWLRIQTEVQDKDYCAAMEIKVTEGKSIPFNAVSKHQVDALDAVRDGIFMYKIPDAGWQNPFDMLVMSGQKAYVIFAFLTPRKKARVWFIDIRVFVTMRENSKEVGVKSANEKLLQKYHEEYGDWCQMFEV